MPPDPHLMLLDGGYWDIDHAAGVCAAAAASTAVGRWLEPAPVLRAAVLFSRYRSMVRDTIRAGVVRLAMEGDRLVAVALWQWCPAAPRWPVAEPGVRDGGGPGDAVRRGDLLNRRAWSLHPDQLHEHLIYLGIVPGRQGHGIAGALLADRPQPERLRAPRYVTATGVGGLFVRHGYHNYGSGLVVAGGGPRLWSMWQVSAVSQVDRNRCGMAPNAGFSAVIPPSHDESVGVRSDTAWRQR